MADQGSSQHRCSHCSQTFNSADELRKHQEKQHQHEAKPSTGQAKQKPAGSNR